MVPDGRVPADVMGYYLLSAETSFSAAHTLPNVEKCERFHGHNWRVRLTVRVDASALGAGGMGIDFRKLEETAQAVVADFDHAYLNELEPFQHAPPTAERLAAVTCSRAAEHLATAAPGVEVAEIEIWETPEYRVVYRPQ